MKKYLAAYLLGFISSTFIAYIIYDIRRGPPISYHYEDIKYREKMISILESRNILYSYEVDHLKRHWITPWIKDVKHLEPVELELEEWVASKNEK